MKKIIFITGSRSDYFIQRPILNLLKKNKLFKIFIILTGSHLSKKYGMTKKIVETDNYGKIHIVRSFIESNKLESRSLGASIQLNKIIKILSKINPNLVIAPYDREEAITLALAATYNNIPIVHLGAGDNTEFNVDALIRHSVSKLSQIMITSTVENKNRLIRMGENKKNIFNVGHTALDRYNNITKLSKKKLGIFFKIPFTSKPIILLVQHPISNYYKEVERQYKETLEAIDKINLPTIIIKPNSDPGSLKIIKQIDNFNFKNNKLVSIFQNIPELYFTNLMKEISLIVGNSSMGILESAIFKTPVVNIGKRQIKRQNSGNVIFVSHNKKMIIKAIKYSLFNLDYQKKLKKCKNVYGKGNASKKIISILEKIKYKSEILIKKYP